MYLFSSTFGSTIDNRNPTPNFPLNPQTSSDQNLAYPTQLYSGIYFISHDIRRPMTNWYNV